MKRLRFILVCVALSVVGPVITADAWAQDKTAKKKSDDGDGDAAEADDAEETSTADQSSSSSSLQRGRRMEFDARLIRGERASGAVFLFQRATRPLPSMVKRRTSYLDDTVTKSLGDDSAEEFRKNQSEALQNRIRAEEEERRKAREASVQKAQQLEKEKAEREKAEKEKAEKEKAAKDKADKK